MIPLLSELNNLLSQLILIGVLILDELMKDLLELDSNMLKLLVLLLDLPDVIEIVPLAVLVSLQLGLKLTDERLIGRRRDWCGRGGRKIVVGQSADLRARHELLLLALQVLTLYRLHARLECVRVRF